MSWKWSTELRNFVMGKGSFRQAFEDCKLMVYCSPIPMEADDAVTAGNLLCTFTKSSGTTTLIRGWGEIVGVICTAATTGQIFKFDCTTGDSATPVVTASYTVPSTDNANSLAHAVKIVRLFTDIGLRACALGTAGGLVYVMGHCNQTLSIALNAGATGGIASFTESTAPYNAGATNDCLRFGPPASAIIAKDTGQTWSGVASQSGTAAYGRIVDVNDLGTDITTDKRLQGTVGVGTGDIQISNANLTSGATYTCSIGTFTFPAE